MRLLPPDPGLYIDEDLRRGIRGALSRQLVPRVITGEEVARYVRKAVRLGVWRELAPETRALLLVCRRLSRPVRSPVLRRILSEVFLEIELAGLRGRALLYGALEFVRRGLGSLREALSNVEKVLCLGISYLSNPPAFRFYG